MTREIEGKKCLCVDFDHTITVTEDEYHFGSEKPNWPVINWIEEQYFAGHTIIVWTARPWSEAAHMVARLTEWGVLFHGIRMAKGGADVYVDDKAVNVKASDWRGQANDVMRAQKWVGQKEVLANDGGEPV